MEDVPIPVLTTMDHSLVHVTTGTPWIPTVLHAQVRNLFIIITLFKLLKLKITIFLTSIICKLLIRLVCEIRNIFCIDIDECATENGGCSDTCWNRVGTFECRCPSGKYLGPDLTTCLGMINMI